MEQIRSFLESVKLARKQEFQNLTVFPLLEADGIEPDYLTVTQALDADSIRITEKSDQGNVPELLLINSGGLCVLIIEGEDLVGAKQNRIVNSTFLIPGKTEGGCSGIGHLHPWAPHFDCRQCRSCLPGEAGIGRNSAGRHDPGAS